MALLREKEFRDYFNERLIQVQAVQKNGKIGWLARVTQAPKDPWVAYSNSAGRFRSVPQTLDVQLGELLC